jgi:hypothetical protein
MRIERHQRLPLAVAGLGVVLLLASVVMRWFAVPYAAADARGALTIAVRDAPVTPVFKALCVLALAAGGWVARRSARPLLVTTRILAALLAALLLYPHAVMVWCPKISAEAEWFHEQHASLTWGGGDIWTSGEYKNFGWKERVYIAPMPEEAGVMDTPSFGPTVVPFESLHDLVNWFGYSKSFCLFASTGWGYALTGAVLLLVAVCRARSGPDRRRIVEACGVGAALLGAASALCLLPAALCAFQIERAHDAAERGLLAVSLERLELAARLLPMIRENGDVVDQIGSLEARLGRQTPAANLHYAKTLERRGKLDEAQHVFASVLRESSEGTIRREAERGLLSRAIDQLNSGQAEDAVANLEAVLAADPCNLKANYAMEAAYLRVRRLESVEALAARMRAVYKYFGSITKVTVLAAAQENVAEAAYLRGDALAAHLAKKKLSDPKLIRTEP